MVPAAVDVRVIVVTTLYQAGGNESVGQTNPVTQKIVLSLSEVLGGEAMAHIVAGITVMMSWTG